MQIGFFDLAPGPNVLALLGGDTAAATLHVSSEAILIPALILLAILVDAGMVGLVLLVTLLGSLAGIGWQLARGRQGPPGHRAIGLMTLGTLAADICNGMFHDVMVIPMVHMFLFFIAGLAITAYTRSPQMWRPAVISRAHPQGVAVTAV